MSHRHIILRVWGIVIVRLVGGCAHCVMGGIVVYVVNISYCLFLNKFNH